MMNVKVYCGEDIVSSRKAFLEDLQGLKLRDFELIRVQGKDFEKNFAVLAIESPSLFGQNKALAIESFLSGQKSEEKEKIIEYLGGVADFPVIFWEGKEFTKAEQEKFPANFVFKLYKIPQTLFSFLDSLTPGEGFNNLSNFEKTLKTVDALFLFQMLIRQFRLLIMSREDLVKLAPWQKAKLKKQASLFDEKHLFFLHKRLLKIDFQQKTSSSPFDLKASLELFVSEI